MEDSEVPVSKTQTNKNVESNTYKKPLAKSCGTFMLPPSLLTKLGLGQKPTNIVAVLSKKQESANITSSNDIRIPQNESENISRVESANRFCKVLETTLPKENTENIFIKDSIEELKTEEKSLKGDEYVMRNNVTNHLEIPSEQLFVKDIEDGNSTISSIVSSNVADNSNVNDLSNILSNSAYNMLLSEDNVLIPSLNDSVLTNGTSSETCVKINSIENTGEHLNLSSEIQAKMEKSPSTKKTVIIIRSNDKKTLNTVLSSPLRNMSTSPIVNKTLLTSTPISIKNINQSQSANNQNNTLMKGDTIKKILVYKRKSTNQQNDKNLDVNTTYKLNEDSKRNFIPITNHSESEKIQSDLKYINSITNANNSSTSFTSNNDKVPEKKYSFKIVSKNKNNNKVSSPQKDTSCNKKTTTSNINVPNTNGTLGDISQTLVPETMDKVQMFIKKIVKSDDKNGIGAATGIKRKLSQDTIKFEDRVCKNSQLGNNIVQQTKSIADHTNSLEQSPNKIDMSTENIVHPADNIAKPIVAKIIQNDTISLPISQPANNIVQSVDKPMQSSINSVESIKEIISPADNIIQSVKNIDNINITKSISSKNKKSGAVSLKDSDNNFEMLTQMPIEEKLENERNVSLNDKVLNDNNQVRVSSETAPSEQTNKKRKCDIFDDINSTVFKNAKRPALQCNAVQQPGPSTSTLVLNTSTTSAITRCKSLNDNPIKITNSTNLVRDIQKGNQINFTLFPNESSDKRVANIISSSPKNCVKGKISPKKETNKILPSKSNGIEQTSIVLPDNKGSVSSSKQAQVIKLHSQLPYDEKLDKHSLHNSQTQSKTHNIANMPIKESVINLLKEIDTAEQKSEMLMEFLNSDAHKDHKTSKLSGKNKNPKKSKLKMKVMGKNRIENQRKGHKGEAVSDLGQFREIHETTSDIVVPNKPVEQKIDDAFAKLVNKNNKKPKMNMQSVADTQIIHDKNYSKKLENSLPPRKKKQYNDDETLPKIPNGYTPRLYEPGTKHSLFNVSSDIDSSTNNTVETDNIENIPRVGIDVKQPVRKRGRPSKRKVADIDISKSAETLLDDPIYDSTSPRYSKRLRKIPKQFTDFETKITNADDSLIEKRNLRITGLSQESEDACLADNEIANIYLSGLQDQQSIIDAELKYTLCGRCGQKVKPSMWTLHALFHNNLAWREDETQIDLKNKHVITTILSKLILIVKVLYCEKCGVPHYDVKNSIKHMTKCKYSPEDNSPLKCNVCGRILSESSQMDHMKTHNSLKSATIEPLDLIDNKITCAVCKQSVINSEWDEHTRTHNYLTWIEGETPVDIMDRNIVQNLLRKTKLKTFKCFNCSSISKSISGFMSHLEACQLQEEEIISRCISCKLCTGLYLPWTYQLHITKCTKKARGPGKTYKNINEKESSDKGRLSEDGIEAGAIAVNGGSETNVPEATKKCTGLKVTCAICETVLDIQSWKFHKKKHNNLAWHQGETPIDLNDERLVEKIIRKVYVNNNKRLKCYKCSDVKFSIPGYLSHMGKCSKSKEEIMDMRKCCTICGRYMQLSSLKVHMSTHKPDSEKSSNLNNDSIKKESNNLNSSIDDDIQSSNHRRKRNAAMNADKLIKSIKQTSEDDPASESTKRSPKITQLYKVPEKRKHISNTIIKVWNRELLKVKDGTKKSSAKCRYTGCNFSSTSLEKMKEHHLICGMLDNRDFTCSICKYGCKDETAIQNHIQSKHPKEFSTLMKTEEKKRNKKKVADYVPEVGAETNDLLEYDSNDEEERPVTKTADLRSVYCKFKYLYDHRLKSSSNDIFPLAYEWTLSFREKNYSADPLFQNWFNLPDSVLTPIEQKLYTSSQKSVRTASIALKCIDDKPNNEKISWREYQPYEGACENESALIFCGGPVWAMAWAPMNPLNEDQSEYLAVSAHNSRNDEYKIDPSLNCSNSKYNIIQIWNMGSLSNKSGKCTSNPKFAMGIAHEAGTIWSMAWCPSGGFLKSEKGPKTRLGLLCVACSNGYAYIYSVSIPDETTDRKLFYKQKPVVILNIDHNNYDVTKSVPWQATKVSWTQEKDHSTIAIGYSDGNVAIYKLNTLSPLLKDEVNGIDFLYPATMFQAHAACVTGISICPRNSSYLMTGSIDRTYAFWKIDGGSSTQTAVLLNSAYKGRVTSVVWLTHWISGVVTYDDSYRTDRSSTTIVSVRDFGYKSQPILNTNSVVWDVSTCDWSNGIAQCSDAGEVSLYYGHQLLYGLDCDKYTRNRRMILSYTDVLKIDKYEKEDNINKDNSNKISAKTKKSIILKKKNSNENISDDEWDLPVEDDDETDVLNLVDSTSQYDEVVSTHGLLFCDLKLKNQCTTEFLKQAPIPQYPLGSVTRVAYNPNWKSHSFLAMATQSGIVRVVCITSKRTRQMHE